VRPLVCYGTSLLLCAACISAAQYGFCFRICNRRALPPMRAGRKGGGEGVAGATESVCTFFPFFRFLLHKDLQSKFWTFL